MKPEIRKLIKEIEANGFPCEQGRTHIRVLNRRRTGVIASLPLTPSRGPLGAEPPRRPPPQGCPVSSGFDWEAARRRDNVRRRGSEPVDTVRPAQPRLFTAKRAGACHYCKKLIKQGDRFAYRNPARLCQPCAIKAFEDGRI